MLENSQQKRQQACGNAQDRSKDARTPALLCLAFAGRLIVRALIVVALVLPVLVVGLALLVVLCLGLLVAAQLALQVALFLGVLVQRLAVQAVGGAAQARHGVLIGALARLGAVAGAVPARDGAGVGLGVLVGQLRLPGVAVAWVETPDTPEPFFTYPGGCGGYRDCYECRWCLRTVQEMFTRGEISFYCDPRSVYGTYHVKLNQIICPRPAGPVSDLP